MNVLGVTLGKKYSDDLMNVFNEEIVFIDNYSDVFDEVKSKKYSAMILEGDELSKDKLLEIIERILNIQKKLIIFVIGERSNLNVVAGTIKAGAYDYILKPIEADKIYRLVDKSIKDQRMKSEKIGKAITVTEDKLIGNTIDMVDIYKMIGKVAASNVPLLISGEGGTGKQLVAKAVHQFSDRAEKNFISVNCTMIQSSVLEKKFFGFESNNGLDSQMGYLEQADNGTLFLRDVGELGLDMQARLLAVLQEGEFTRIGGSNLLKTDVRIIASSSKNLEELINDGKFREDLYHKLKVVEINVPALRERKDDIPYLIENFMSQFNHTGTKNIKGVSKPAMKKIMKYDWPGNIRELKNTIKSAITLCRGTNILPEDLPANVIGAKISKRHGDIQDWVLADWIEGEIDILNNNNQKNYYGNVISRVERELIRQVLEITNGKKVEAAEILGITRNTLRTKMNNYGLD